MSNTDVINTFLGDLCNRHPNICLFANGKLNAEESKDFVMMELHTICHFWSTVPTKQSVTDFVDAYWIAKCIMKHETEYTTDDPEPFAKCVDCHYIIQEVPNVTLNGIPGSPFWQKLCTVINDIKIRINRGHFLNKQQKPNSDITDRNCLFKQQHSDIVRIAKGELKPIHCHAYYDACDTMMSLLDVWSNITFQESPLEQYLFGENRRGSSEYRVSALEDICETYWLIKAWLTAIDYDDEDDIEDEDDDIKDAVATARRMCDKVSQINEHLGTLFINLSYFCEYRVKVRNVLKDKFKFVDSVDRLHDASYGKA